LADNISDLRRVGYLARERFKIYFPQVIKAKIASFVIALEVCGTINRSLMRKRSGADHALPANIPPLSDHRTDTALVIHPAFPFACKSGFNDVLKRL